MPSGTERHILSRSRRRAVWRHMISAVTFGALVAAAPTPAFAKSTRFTDNCLEARQPFSRIKNFQGNRIAGGALIGAGLGALVGVLGNSGKQNKSSVLPTVLAGAAAGGAAGYLSSISQDQRNKDELRAAIDADFDPVMNQYSALPGQLEALGQCRRTQIETVEREAGAATLSRKEAEKRLASIEKWIAEDDRVIAKASGIQGQTVTTFAQANAVADGADPTLAQQDGWASRYYGIDDDAPVETAEAAAVTRYIRASSGARLRDAPSTGGRIIETVANGAAVDALGDGGDGWMFVRTASGMNGYIHGGLLGASAMPVAVAAKPAAASPGRARIDRAVKAQRSFAATQEREKKATTVRLAAARSLLAGA